MTLIYVTTSDNSKNRYIVADTLELLRQKAEEKFCFKIEKFVRKDTNKVIENDKDLSNDDEICLIAVERLSEISTLIPVIKVYLFNSQEPKLIKANSLVSLKSQIEKELGIIIKKIVRKKDGLEIANEKVFDQLIESDKDLSLLVLQQDEEFNSGFFNFDKVKGTSILPKRPDQPLLKETNDVENYFDLEYDDFDNNLKDLKDLKLKDKPTNITSISGQSETILTTVKIQSKKKELEEKSKEEKLKMEARIKQMEELKKIEQNLQKQKKKADELDNEYNRKLFDYIATKQVSEADLAKKEAKLVELNLKQEKISLIFNDLKLAEKVDICFLMDCTGSMEKYIIEAKTVVHRIVDMLKKKFTNFDLRTAFVGYRDHNDKERITLFQLSENIDNFKSFVSDVKAYGGADECEDVFGGLEETIKLNWSNMTRVLFHIGDAPCHGKRYHNGASDKYSTGDPRGLKIENLLKEIVSKNISYYFAQINKSTIKMIDEFNKELEELGGQKIKVLSLSSAEFMTKLVTKAVHESIAESKQISMHIGHKRMLKNKKVDSSYLTWSKLKMKKYKAEYYEAKFTGSITEIKTKPIEFEKKSVEVYLADKPFAKGALRFAYSGLLNDKKSVLKESCFNDPELNTFQRNKDMIEIQVIAAFLAKEFFSILNSQMSIRFIDVNLVHLIDEGNYFCIEDYMSGDFKKWINNAGDVNEDIYSCTLNAFSHWTYQATNEYLIVNDLQGIKIGNEYILTDPAITSPEGIDRFSTTNLGTKGIQKFFETHQCNNICKYLKLKKHEFQILPDREENPYMTKILNHRF